MMWVLTRQGTVTLVCLLLIGSLQLSSAADDAGNPQPQPTTLQPSAATDATTQTASSSASTASPTASSPSSTALPTTSATTTPSPATTQPASSTSDDPATSSPAPSMSSASPDTTSSSPSAAPTTTAAPTTGQPSTTATADIPASSKASSDASTSSPTSSEASSDASTSSPTTASPTQSSPSESTAAPSSPAKSTTAASSAASQSASAASDTAAPTTAGPPADKSTSAPTAGSSDSTAATATTPSADQSTSASSAAAPSTTAAATTTPTPEYPTKKPDKPFQLAFKVGNSNDSVVYCVKTDSCTFSTIVGDVQTAFSSVQGYLYVRQGDSTSSRRKRDTQIPVEVLFEAVVLSGLSEEEKKREIHGALNTLNASPDLAVDMDRANDTIVDPFAAQTADVCKIPGACLPGYRCENSVCHHLCENYDCGEHGVCNTILHADGTSSAKCVCSSDDDHTYSGDRCQDEETSKAKVAAILGGVLGTLCALFLVVIIFLCCRLRSEGEGSRGKYQLGGYSNNGYADHEFAMKDVTSGSH